MDDDPTVAGFCGVILSGGTAARMDGVDKASVVLAGETFLELALAAFRDADEVVVVGPECGQTSRPVTFVGEDPPLGGPVAGLLAGVAALRRRPRHVGVLAVDMPRVTASTMARLRDAAAGADGAFLVGTDGRRQLAGVLDGPRLAAVRPSAGQEHGLALHRLLQPLDLVEVPAVGEEGRDVDSWSDLRDLEP